jgi:hypothetical protein
VAVLVPVTVILGVLAKDDHLPAILVGIPVVLIVLAIRLFQRR